MATNSGPDSGVSTVQSQKPERGQRKEQRARRPAGSEGSSGDRCGCRARQRDPRARRSRYRRTEGRSRDSDAGTARREPPCSRPNRPSSETGRRRAAKPAGALVCSGQAVARWCSARGRVAEFTLVLTLRNTVAFGRRCIPAGCDCSSLKYSRYSRSSRLAIGAPRRPRCLTVFLKGST